MRSAGIIIWQQIAEVLAGEIASGTITPGARLPTEMVLAQRFGVNRHTLRRAVAALEADGLVSVQHGRGTFVRSPPVVDYALGPRTRFSEIVSGQSRIPEGELLSGRREAAAMATADLLGLSAGSPVSVLEILRRVDGLPVSVSSTYFDAARFGDIDAAFRDTGSLTSALARFGVSDYMRRGTRIWTRLPTQEEALLLRQAVDAPVLVMESVDEDINGRTLQFSRTRAAGERLQLLVAG